MDIGKRISDMSEHDAKVALLHMVHSAERALDCSICPAGCKHPSKEVCLDRVLDEALEDIR